VGGEAGGGSGEEGAGSGEAAVQAAVQAPLGAGSAVAAALGTVSELGTMSPRGATLATPRQCRGPTREDMAGQEPVERGLLDRVCLRSGSSGGFGMGLGGGLLLGYSLGRVNSYG
jgi:hypothetical protein